MNDINDGGPAFPHQKDYILYHNDDPTKPAQTIKGVWAGGMSLRDYFAAKAMQSIYIRFGGGACAGNADGALNHAADCAYIMADAMLAARGKA